MTHPAQHTAAIHDVMAAELLASAARVEPEARELKKSINTLLGTAYIHKKRSERLNDAAIKATLDGIHDAAAVIGRAAAEELEAAAEHEAVAMGAVRGMHSFGFMTADEQRFIQRKKFEEGMTSGQAEDIFSKMLDNMFQSAVNYGVDEDGFGGEADADEPDELEDRCGPASRMGSMFAALGGDFPLVFGEDAYARFGVVFGASVARLESRRSRLRLRLEKLQERLETLEGAGKTGLRVRFLRRRVDKLESRIDKISKKIESMGGAKKAADESEEESEQVKSAEKSAAKSAARGADEDAELDSMEAIATELDGDESETDDEDDDKDDEEDDEISGLIAEVNLFGASERRSDRIRRRVTRLEARLNKLLKRRRGLLKNVRVRRLRKRIDALKAKLVQVNEELPPSLSSSPSGGSYVSALTAPILKAYPPDQYIKSWGGSLNAMPEIAEREPYVQFFRRKAEAMGSLNLDMDTFGAENEGFFARIGRFFKETFTAKGRQERRDRKEKQREYLELRAASINACRAQATLDRNARIKAAIEDRNRQIENLDKSDRRYQSKTAEYNRQTDREIRRIKREHDARSRRCRLQRLPRRMKQDSKVDPGQSFQSNASERLRNMVSAFRPGIWVDDAGNFFNVDQRGQIFLVWKSGASGPIRPVLVPDQAKAKSVLVQKGRLLRFDSGTWIDNAGNVFAVNTDGQIYLTRKSGQSQPLPAPLLIKSQDQDMAKLNLIVLGRRIT